mmetsp:Transcript_17003/g.26221  ORF Transcript_17003/g.26221 Transcript_17003/m.26221 type:complete len:94 (-) Transcript_17003:399-680(-)
MERPSSQWKRLPEFRSSSRKSTQEIELAVRDVETMKEINRWLTSLKVLLQITGVLHPTTGAHRLLTITMGKVLHNLITGLKIMRARLSGRWLT